MKTIIRIEHVDGIGPFTGLNRPHNVYTICNSIVRRHCEFNTPKEDGLVIESDDYCAYRSIEHIQQWVMQDEFQILFANGYDVYLLEVTECKEGKDNTLFKKQHITLKRNISSLFGKV